MDDDRGRRPAQRCRCSLLAVEVLSPSTRRIDQVLERERYQRAGVTSYWIIEPAGPSVTSLELRDGEYVELGSATADETLHVALPEPMALRPAAWLD